MACEGKFTVCRAGEKEKRSPIHREVYGVYEVFRIGICRGCTGCTDYRFAGWEMYFGLPFEPRFMNGSLSVILPVGERVTNVSRT